MKKHWKNPFKFDPERFSPQNSKGRHKFCFLPFSLGPRMCLGNHFSLIEQKLFLIRLLQKYEILPPKDHVLTEKLSSTFGGPQDVWISLRNRKIL